MPTDRDLRDSVMLLANRVHTRCGLTQLNPAAKLRKEGVKMRRTTITLLSLLAVASIGIAVVWAEGAHFQKNSVSAAIQSNGNLIVSFQEAGLGFTNIDYTVKADVVATYFCRTNSGSIPNAENKHTVSAPVSQNASFEPKNGKVTGSITLEAPDAPVSEPPTCGRGQSLDLQSLTYSNVVLTDTTNGISTNVAKGTFSITLYPAP
jgi:hypothetical protein